MVIRQVYLSSRYPEERAFRAANPGRAQMLKSSCWTEAYGPPKKLGFLWCLLTPRSFSFQRSLGEVARCHAAGQDSCPLSPVPLSGSRRRAWPFWPGEGGWVRHDLTSDWVKLKAKYSRCPLSVGEVKETPTANCKIWRPDLKGATL